MSDKKFQKINELGHFMIDGDGRPWSFVGSTTNVVFYEDLGKSVKVTVQGYVPNCLEMIDSIHGNHIAVTQVHLGPGDEYKEEELVYLFRCCHEISRLTHIGSVQFDGSAVLMTAVFVAHLEVIDDQTSN